MSEGTESEPEQVQGYCDCPAHKIANTKVRAIQVDGENYYNGEDLGDYLVKFVTAALGRLVVEKTESGELTPDMMNDFGAFCSASISCVEAVRDQIILMSELSIRPLSDEDGLLVAPEETKVGDHIPEGWAQT